MASIDYQVARKEIIKMFDNAINDRKIVFWYDSPKNFMDDIINDKFENFKLLVCDKNEFEIKKTIEIEDLSSNYLIYVPNEKPVDTENWLLDILMYSEEYYADTVALIMRRFELSNTDLRKVVEKHSKFFDSEIRSKKLNSVVYINDSMSQDDLRLGMMAVLTKANNPTIESILTELVFDDSEHSKYNELRKFKFEDYLWDKVCIYYNYDGDLKIDSLVKKFMFTTFISQCIEDSNSFENMPSFYNQFLLKEKSINDARRFVENIELDKRYEFLQASLCLDMKIEGLIANKDIKSLLNTDVFEQFDIYIISTIAKSLQSGSLDYETFERIIYTRINSQWYKKYNNEYKFLMAGIKFLKLIEKPILQNLSVNEYINNYVNQYYKIDKEYRHVCTNFKKIENPSEEFEVLINKVEKIYQSNYLDNLGREYSKALEKQKDWDFIGVEKTCDFYKYIQRRSTKKCFVIISDAFRYEIGHELYENIKSDPILKGGVEIDYAISTLPSETRQGMAALLPHNNMEYSDGLFYVDGLSTNGTEARNKVLFNKNEFYSAIKYEKINNFSRSELRQYMQDKNLVYIYHDVVDNTGEHNESKVFDVVDTAINEILLLIKKLYNNLQISNFYVTADHGFLYRRNEIEELNKYCNVVGIDACEISKRYVITDNTNTNIPYTNEFILSDVKNKKLKVITPYGYDLFKTQGAGIQYVHGGASLHETIVPIIHISELRSGKLKETIGPVGVRLKSITRKITNRSFTLEFEQYEKVEDKKQAITCETYIIDDKGNRVSNEYRFVANSSSDDKDTRLTRVRYTLNNIDFDRNRPYFMILKNVDKYEEYLEKEPFTIDIIGFKMF